MGEDNGERWRIMVLDRPAGPWRATRAEAQADAIDTGNAEHDELRGITFMIVPAWLQREGRR